MAIRIQTLGRTELLSGDAMTAIPIRGKPFALLCRLAFPSPRRLSRDALAEELWSDLPAEKGRAQLRTAIWALRRHLGNTAIGSSDATVELQCLLASDRADFERAITDGRRNDAIALYTGDFLANFALSGAAGFDQWADLERRTLSRLFVATAESEINSCLETGRSQQALSLAARVRDLDPLNLSAWRLLLKSLTTAGQAESARVSAAALEELLREERLPCDAETRSAIERASKASPARPADIDQAGIQPDLVAREREFAILLGQLDATARGQFRVIQLIGGAGIGKTRLLSEFVLTAKSRKNAAVYVTGTRPATTMPYLVVARIAEALAALPGAAGVPPDVADVLVELSPALATSYPNRSGRHGNSADSSRERLIAVAELVRCVSSEQPLMVVVDDAQWADESSRGLLEALPVCCPECAVLVVLAEREPRPTATAARARIRLVPIHRTDCEALVNSVATLPADPWGSEWVSRLHTISGGVPLLILDSLHLAIDRGLVAIVDGRWETSNSKGLLAFVDSSAPRRDRIERLSPDPRRVVLLCACAEGPVPEPVVREVLGIDAERLAVAMAELLSKGIARIERELVQLDHDEYAASAKELVHPTEERTLLRALSGVYSRATEPRTIREAWSLADRAGDTELATSMADRFLQLARRQSPVRKTTDLLAELTGTGAAGIRYELLAARFDARRRWARLGWIAATLVLLASATLGLAVSRLRTVQPDAELTLFLADENNQLHEAAKPLSIEGWRDGEPIEVSAQRLVLPTWSAHLPSRTRQPPYRWAVQVSTDSVNVDDIAVFADGGPGRKVISGPGDDVAPAWSPDGTQLVFATARWSRGLAGDLAIADLQRDTVIRLGGGPGELSQPHFSHDGRWVVFVRARDQRTNFEVCAMALADQSTRCRHIATPLIGPSNVTWVPPSSVRYSVRDTRLGISRVITWDRETDEEHESATCRGAFPPTQSLGSFVVCRSDSDAARLQVAPLSQPDLWRPVMVKADGRQTVVGFLMTDLRLPPAFTAMRIASAPVAVVGVRHRLTAMGVRPDGDSTALRSTWRVIEGNAIIDSLGYVRADRAGPIRISAASTDGLRAETLLQAIPASSRILLAEDWGHDWQTRWHPFGEPMPTTEMVNGAPAFWNRGDGTYYSGAYLRQTWNAQAGLAFDADVEIPVNPSGKQMLRVSLIDGGDSVALSKWNHRSGYMPFSAASQNFRCEMEYPTGVAGPSYGRLIDSPADAVPAPPGMSSGRRHRVRLQIFPDGRCGLAIDGTPISVSETPRRWVRGRPVLLGSSVGTRVLVYRATLHEGVPTDIRWP